MNGFLRKLANYATLGLSPLSSAPRNLEGNQFQPTVSGRVIYAIGDIHGRIDLLAKIHQEIDHGRTGAEGTGEKVEIYLGDMIDRGADSAAVIESLIARSTECKCVFLSGNHELEFLKILGGSANSQQVLNWLKFGGVTTAMSYGLTSVPNEADDSIPGFVTKLRAKVPEAHLEMLKGCKLYCVEEPYIFVHAGLRPNISLADQKTDDLVGIREEFLTSKLQFPFIVVHGHSPVRQVELLANRINLDTGAYATGILSGIEIGPKGIRVLVARK